MKKLLALLIACLALFVAACGDDDDDEGATNGGTAAPAETTDTGAAPTDMGAGGATKVDIPSISFDPESVTVKSGTTVTWTNSDDLPHTVTKEGGPGPDFDSGTIEPGGEFEQTIEGKGEIDYVCTIHPGQEGSITVE